MSEFIKGRISKITDPNKGGYCALVIDGNFYNSAAKGKPPFSVGDVVSFEFYLKQDKYRTIQGQVTKCEDVADPKPSTSPVGALPTKAPFQSAKDKYWEDKEIYEREVVQPRIAFYAAVERAIHLTDIVLREKAIPGLDKAKPEARLEIIQNLVFELTDDILKRSIPVPIGATIEGLNKALDKLEDEGQWA